MVYEAEEIRATDVTNANLLNNLRVNVTRHPHVARQPRHAHEQALSMQALSMLRCLVRHPCHAYVARM